MNSISRLTPWCIVGDFNMPLDFLEEQFGKIQLGWPKSIDYFQHCPIETQQSGGILDYIYFERYQLTVSTCREFPSDHRIIETYI